MYDTIKQDREAVEYLNAIIEKVTVKLEKLQEKHEVEGVMNQRSIYKVEDELSILEYIIHDFRSRVSAQEAKEKFHEELNKFAQSQEEE